MQRIAADEDDRRKSTDGKLSTAQATIGLIVSLSSGSLALYFFQSPHLDLWRILAALAFVVELFFFIFAARKVVKAMDPETYRGRKAEGVERVLKRGGDRRALLEDELRDLVSIVPYNECVTNRRLTLYRAAIENIWKGVLFAGAVPAIAMLAYAVNSLFGPSLPVLLREEPTTTSFSSPRGRTTSTPRITPPPHSKSRVSTTK